MRQNLLNSSGQAQALQRARQIDSYVQTRTRTQDLSSEGVEFKTFEDVMNSSLNVHTRFNVHKDTSVAKFGALTQKKVEAKPVVTNIFEQEPATAPSFSLPQMWLRARIPCQVAA